MVTIQFKKLTESAKVPTRGSDFAAGYDLYATETYTLQPLERKLFKTGLSVAIPSGLYGRIAPRSGLAFKNGLDVMAGVIDEDYRGDVGVLLINLSNEPINLPLVKDGKEVPIAQIIFENYTVATFQESAELPPSIRATGGFGSTDAPQVVFKDGVWNAITSKTIADALPPITESRVVGVTMGKTLADLYQKSGGVAVKRRYSEEVKERNQS